jgi:cytidylate kinase
MTEPSQRFEKCQSYITSHIRRAEMEEAPGEGHPTVTLSREAGTGAIDLSDKLVDYLNLRIKDTTYPWTVFDKNLVKLVIEDHALPERLERYMPEDKVSRITDTISDMIGLHPPSWELVKHMHSTIYRLAKLGNCIIVGRGGNIITRDLPNVLHLRLVGAVDKRIERYKDQHDISREEAGERIKKEDRTRRRYLLTYYDVEIEDPANYHLVINVDRFTSEQLVEFIGKMIANWKAQVE